jgi:hypothetical protein
VTSASDHLQKRVKKREKQKARSKQKYADKQDAVK